VLGRYGARWLNEAITEHIASSFAHGQPDVIAPCLRENDNKIYKEERDFLSVLLEEGPGEDIPVKMATFAYAEQRPDAEYQKAFAAALEKKWGRHVTAGGSVLGLLSEHISRLEAKNMHLGAKSKRRAEKSALVEARLDLLHRPDKIFGRQSDSGQLTFRGEVISS
jgi:hypothetical protein